MAPPPIDEASSINWRRCSSRRKRRRGPGAVAAHRERVHDRHGPPTTATGTAGRRGGAGPPGRGSELAPGRGPCPGCPAYPIANTQTRATFPLQVQAPDLHLAELIALVDPVGVVRGGRVRAGERVGERERRCPGCRGRWSRSPRRAAARRGSARSGRRPPGCSSSRSPRADDRLSCRSSRRGQAGREVVAIAVDEALRKAPCRRRTAGEDRRRRAEVRGRVEVHEVAVRLGERRHVLVAEAEVQRQVRR